MSMIKKKGMESFDGLEGEATEDTGEKENSMDLESILEMGPKGKVSGKTGQELDGLVRRKLRIFHFLYRKINK